MNGNYIVLKYIVIELNCNYIVFKAIFFPFGLGQYIHYIEIYCHRFNDDYIVLNYIVIGLMIIYIVLNYIIIRIILFYNCFKLPLLYKFDCKLLCDYCIPF